LLEQLEYLGVFRHSFTDMRLFVTFNGRLRNVGNDLICIYIRVLVNSWTG